MTADSERNPVELLAEEFLQRYRRGERPALSEYTQRHPEHAAEIRELFPMLLDLEHVLPDTDDRFQTSRDGVSHPPQIGDYRIIREIGRGGMGIVYEAEQQSLGRSVALKVLPSQNTQDKLARERFRREARAAAQLHHTNIVPVFDVGQEGTTSYYAMQYIRGQPFDSVIRDLRCRVATDSRTPVLLPLTASDWGLTTHDADATVVTVEAATSSTSDPAPQRVASPSRPISAVTTSVQEVTKTEPDYRSYFRSVALVGTQVSEALSYAHARGIVHRDIKPSNLLLDTNGVVWVTDFGMAKTDAEPLTRTGDILGTIHYMAPERFRGQCDLRADIYALGLTIYELLTLQPAFESTDRLRLVELIAKHDPPRPRSLNPRIPRDLETIVLKAIEKDPRRRYQSAQELADDLQCFLEDRPILTRRVSLRERFVRWTCRNPVLSGLSITIALMLFLALVGAIATAVVMKRSTDRAVAAERTAEAKAEQLLQQSYVNWVNLAYLECRNDNVARAQEYLQNCPPAQRGWEWQFVASQCAIALRSMQETGHSVNCLDFSPDGQWLAIGTGNFLNRRGPPGDLIVRDVWTGEVKFAHHELADGVTAVAYSPDGNRLASANGRRLTVWNAESGEKLFSTEGETHDLLCLAYSPDGRIIAGGFGRFNASHIGHARLWDAQTGDEIGEPLPGSSAGVWDLAFDPSGQRLALTSEDLVEVWELESRQRVAQLQSDAGFIYSVAYHPEGRYLAAGGLDRMIRLWDVDSQQLRKTFTGHTGFVRGLAFSPDGRRMISASEDKSLRLWDVQLEREIATLHGHTHFVNCVCFSSKGNIIASGSLDQSIKVWYASGENQLVYNGHLEEGHVRALAFSPSGEALASGSLRFPGPTGRLHLWDSDTGEQLIPFPQNVEEVSSIDFRHDGARLAAGHVSGIVTIWDARTAELLFELEAHVSEVHDVAYSPDGSFLASVGQDTGVNIWNAETGFLVRTAVGHEDYITSVEFSPDGTAIATASEDGTVKVWETDTARNLLTMRHPSGEVRNIAFSPDGARLVSTGGIDHRRGDVLIWDAQSGRQLCSLPGHTDIVYDVDFSPDGQRFATASDDRTIKLWDAVSAREVFTMRGHTGGVVSVEFSPDGRRIASGGVDRTVRVWSLTPPDIHMLHRREAVAEYAVGRRLLAQQRWEEAITAFSRAAELGFEQALLRLHLAAALQNHLSRRAAEEQIRQAVSHAPEHATTLAWLALELVRRGYPTQAARAIDRAVRLAPQDTSILSATGRVRSVTGQLDQAHRDFEQAISHHKASTTSPTWWYQTGWWYVGPFDSELSTEEAPQRAVTPIQSLVDGDTAAPKEQVAWITAPVEGDGYLDLSDPFRGAGAMSTYAVQHIYASTKQDVAFLVGADDGIRLWLNGELTFEQTRANEVRIGRHAIAAVLQPGWNTVLAQLANQAGPHGMYFQVSNRPRDRARGAARQSQWDQVITIWSTATSSEKDDLQLLALAGDAFARKGHWQESASVFQRLIERQPARNRNWVSLAPLLVYLGDLDRYREYRRELLASFGKTSDPITAERTSKASLLIPLSMADAALPKQLAGQAVVAGADHGLLPYFLFAKGLSEYRTNEYQMAIDTLKQSLAGNRSRWPYLDVGVSMFLAMSYEQLGEHSLASQTFREADRIFAERLPAADSRDFGVDWLDYLICELARREARQLLLEGP